MILVDYKLDTLIRVLKQVDPDILDVIQFGSSVYAPDLARDLDLLITTSQKKAYGIYLDALADWSGEVDVIVREPGERIADSIALNVCAVSTVVYGNGETLEESKVFMAIPTYEEARIYLTVGDRNLRTAQQEQDKLVKDRLYRQAFDALFHAARQAAMTALATDDSRWGKLRRALPQPFSERFRQIIGTLHISYSYDGNYPKDRADEEFSHWRGEVSQFIQDLENK